jgi:hypothetical protein
MGEVNGLVGVSARKNIVFGKKSRFWAIWCEIVW